MIGEPEGGPTAGTLAQSAYGWAGYLEGSGLVVVCGAALIKSMFM